MQDEHSSTKKKQYRMDRSTRNRQRKVATVDFEKYGRLDEERLNSYQNGFARRLVLIKDLIAKFAWMAARGARIDFEEAEQEITMWLWRQYRSYEDNGSVDKVKFSTWAFKVVERKAQSIVAHYRRQLRVRELLTCVGDDIDNFPIGDDQPDPLKAIDKACSVKYENKAIQKFFDATGRQFAPKAPRGYSYKFERAISDTLRDLRSSNREAAFEILKTISNPHLRDRRPTTIARAVGKPIGWVSSRMEKHVRPTLAKHLKKYSIAVPNCL